MNKILKSLLVFLFLIPLSCDKDDNNSDNDTSRSNEKSIISFSFSSSDNESLSNDVFGQINEDEGVINLSISSGIDISNLVPTIEISELATISPDGPQNFNSPLTYVVTAEDNSTKEYTINVLLEQITLVSMEPTSGPKNTLVTFTGTNFGNDVDLVKVFFGDLEAEVELVSQTSITAIVPPKSYSGNVKILIGEQEFNDFVFDYEISDIQVSIVTGTDAGYADGDASISQFSYPNDITVGSDGNLYITDTGNSRIRKVTYEYVDDLLAGISVSTLAGNGNDGLVNGNGQNAEFDVPLGITSDSNGTVYVSDFFNHSIRVITPNGEVSTLIDQSSSELTAIYGSEATFDPEGITIDEDGNLFIVERSKHSILKVSSSGEISIIAGDGTSGYLDGAGSTAKFSNPKDIAIDSSGNLYVTDSGNNVIRKINTVGEVSTFAGSSTSGFSDGIGANANFNYPHGITIDTQDNLYVVDLGNHSVRKVNMSGAVTTLAGNGMSGFVLGSGDEAQFNRPRGISIDINGNLYVVDYGNSSIRMIIQE